MIARIIECSDHDVQYGILTVDNVTLEEVQNKIYEIKRKFNDEGFNDWCIYDLFEEFPWEWIYTRTDCDDVIEI